VTISLVPGVSLDELAGPQLMITTAETINIAAMLMLVFTRWNFTSFLSEVWGRINPNPATKAEYPGDCLREGSAPSK
jgi:hypothetical protein